MRLWPNKRWKRILAGTALALLALLIVLRILLEPVALRLVNRLGPKLLNADLRLGDLELALLRGELVLRDLHVAQPSGFGGAPMFRASSFRARVALRSLLGGPLIIRDVELSDAAVRLVYATNGTLNVEALVPADPAQAQPETDEEAGLIPLTLQHLTIANFTLTYEDNTWGDEPLILRITELNGTAREIEMEPAARDLAVLPGSAELTGRILQDPHVDARFGLRLRLGVIDTNLMPAAYAVFRMVGLELETLKPAVPPGTGPALGGDSLDLALDLRMEPGFLDCRTRLIATGNTLTLNIGGTPAEPEVDKTSAVFNVFRRACGGAGRMVGRVGNTGVQVAGTAVGTGVAVVKGAGRTAGSIGRGIFRAVRSAARRDMAGASRAIQAASKETARNVQQTVTNTAVTLAHGAKQTAKTVATGDKALEKWRAGADKRWDEAWANTEPDLAALIAQKKPERKPELAPPEPAAPEKSAAEEPAPSSKPGPEPDQEAEPATKPDPAPEPAPAPQEQREQQAAPVSGP